MLQSGAPPKKRGWTLQVHMGKEFKKRMHQGRTNDIWWNNSFKNQQHTFFLVTVEYNLCIATKKDTMVPNVTHQEYWRIPQDMKAFVNASSLYKY